jgi:hypothetical protein
MTPLTRDELQILHAAAHLESVPDDGSRQNYVRGRLGLPWTTYIARLNRVIDTQAALAEAPLLVNRLRRRRDAVLEQRGVLL